MIIEAYYPSGDMIHIHGQWIGPDVNGNNFTVAIVLDQIFTIGNAALLPGSTLHCDPRAVVINVESREVIYTPRTDTSKQKWATDWLKEHSEWPEVLEYSETFKTGDGAGCKVYDGEEF